MAWVAAAKCISCIESGCSKDNALRDLLSPVFSQRLEFRRARLVCSNSWLYEFLLLRFVRPCPLLLSKEFSECRVRLRISTWLWLRATLARIFCTAESSASSIATWFLTRPSLGQVARSPLMHAWSMNSVVGFSSIRGTFEYCISG